MEFFFSQFLSQDDACDLCSLIRLCEEYEDTRLMFSLSDSDGCYFLAREDGKLISVLAMYPAGFAFECTAATLPEKRHQGLFAALLSMAEERFPETDFHFLTDGNSADASAVLSLFECEPIHKDCMMALDNKKFYSLFPSSSFLLDGMSVVREDTEDGTVFKAYIRPRYQTVKVPVYTATCAFSPGQGDGCIWGVSTEKAFRRRGMGKALLCYALNDIFSSGLYKSVILHVDGSNLPAITMYEKIGFSTVQNIFYYLY